MWARLRGKDYETQKRLVEDTKKDTFDSDKKKVTLLYTIVKNAITSQNVTGVTEISEEKCVRDDCHIARKDSSYGEEPATAAGETS